MKKWIWILFLCCACSQGNRPIGFKGTEMTLPYQIMIGHSLDENQKQKALQVIEKTFHEVNWVYNRWNPHSEISKINREKGPFILSKELETFFDLIDPIVEMTDGRFDPTIAPLMENKELVSEDQIGWNKIIRKGNLLQKAHPQMAFDFCGVAKGYCVDLLIERLQALGYTNLFVEWAGDIRSSGSHPPKSSARP